MSFKLKNILGTTLILGMMIHPVVCYSASKEMYFLGGGGEPFGDTTIFDYNVKRVGNFAKKSDWKTSVSFNGGHKTTETIIKSDMGKSRDLGPFTRENYDKALAEMIAKIESGELKAGDQLLVNIDTHGAERTKDDKTHKIAFSDSTANDLVTLAGAQTSNLDGLEKLAQVASEKGVKLAIIDLSCFSGNLLNIDSEKTCMISATGKNQFGYEGTNDFIFFDRPTSFSGNFLKSMKKGKNLEEIFLKARAESPDPDFPMISTNEGKAINDHIYNMISSYLNYDDDSSNLFSRDYELQPDIFSKQQCSGEQNFQKLSTLLKQYENMMAVSDKTQAQEFLKLRKALEKYRDYQVDLEQVLGKVFEVSAEVDKILKDNFSGDEELWKHYRGAVLVNANFEPALKFNELMVEHSSNSQKENWEKSLKNLKRLIEISKSVKGQLSEESNLKLKRISESMANSKVVTKKLAEDVAIETRQVYDRLYKMQKNKYKENPCRDFVL